MRSRLLIVCALALALASPAAAGDGMFVGAAEDAARSADPVHAQEKMMLARLAGFDAIRITSTWAPGRSAPTERELDILRTTAGAAQLNGIRLIVSVYHRNQRTTPRTPAARRQFASYVAAIAREAPAFHDFIIGNEPNLNLFWMPQFNRNGTSASPAAYLKLLAASYDALKAVSPDINVVGGSVSPRGQDNPRSKRHTHSPTRFIQLLGRAYRKSGRTRPIMDAFAFHPYLIPSRLPPTFRFANPKNTTIALSDYGKLARLLARAFDGTAQPGSTLPIVYDEFGYQSRIPLAKQHAYVNLDHPVAADAIDEATQAEYYRRSLAIAQCQPNVAGMLLFHVSDESNALAWQSGVYYADDTPKTSFAPVRAAALAAREGTLARCRAPKRVNPVREVVFTDHESVPATTTRWSVDVACDRPCRYVIEIAPGAPAPISALDRLTGAASLQATGYAVESVPTRATLPSERLAPGIYQYVVRVFQIGRPGTAVTRYSDLFSVEPELASPA
jgi:hypothetical protein